MAFFDVAASPEGRSLDLETLRRVVGAVEIPVAAGGGLRSVADVEAVLAAGAKKATLATVAFQNPDVVKEAVARFGSESIAVALDANRNVKMHSQREVFLMAGGCCGPCVTLVRLAMVFTFGTYRCCSHCWKKRSGKVFSCCGLR